MNPKNLVKNQYYDYGIATLKFDHYNEFGHAYYFILITSAQSIILNEYDIKHYVQPISDKKLAKLL